MVITYVLLSKIMRYNIEDMCLPPQNRRKMKINPLRQSVEHVVSILCKVGEGELGTGLAAAAVSAHEVA
jgi:hypothetical protein